MVVAQGITGTVRVGSQGTNRARCSVTLTEQPALIAEATRVYCAMRSLQHDRRGQGTGQLQSGLITVPGQPYSSRHPGRALCARTETEADAAPGSRGRC